jgi:hypothetical protein
MTPEQDWILKEIAQGASAIVVGSLFAELSRWDLSSKDAARPRAGYAVTVPIADLANLVTAGFLRVRDLPVVEKVTGIGCAAYELTEKGHAFAEGQ